MARRATSSRTGEDPRQPSLFGAGEVFPVRRPAERYRPLDLSLRIKTALSQALKECPDSAAVIAARMSELLGREQSVDMLYAYTAASKPEHDIGISRLVAFIRATGARWIYDIIVEDDGLLVIEGRESKLAQLGLMQQEAARLQEQVRILQRELRDAPVDHGAAGSVRRGRTAGGAR